MNEIYVYIIFYTFGMICSALCFLALNVHFKRDLKPMKEDLKELQDFYNSMNVSTIASLKYYDQVIKDLKLAPKAPELPQSLRDAMDTMEYLSAEVEKMDRKVDMIELSEKQFELKMKTQLKEAELAHREKISQVEAAISNLSPIHRHWHNDKQKNALTAEQKKKIKDIGAKVREF